MGDLRQPGDFSRGLDGGLDPQGASACGNTSRGRNGLTGGDCMLFGFRRPLFGSARSLIYRANETADLGD
ncbi:hypothetical protein D3C84_1250180 [compost metagenome]